MRCACNRFLPGHAGDAQLRLLSRRCFENATATSLSFLLIHGRA